MIIFFVYEDKLGLFFMLGVTTLLGVNLGSFLRPQAFCPVWLIKYKNTSGPWVLASLWKQ